MRQSVWQRLTRELLREINLKRQALSNIQERLSYLKDEMERVKGPVLNTTPVQGGALNKEEERRLNNMALRAELSENAKALEREIENFDKAWQCLTELERIVLTVFFVEPQRDCVKRLSDQLGCEKSKIYYLRNDALYKMTLCLYGK